MLAITQSKGSELINLFNQIFDQNDITGYINAENLELKVTSKIFIEKSQIVYATSTMYHSRFGDLMIKKGIITPKELNTALRIQKEDIDKTLIGNILVDMGVISERVIPNLLYHQIEVVIYEILSWKSANLTFEEYDIQEHPEFKSPVSPDETKGLYSNLNKLLDSKGYISYLLVNLDEIVKIRQHLNNPDNIPTRANKDQPNQLTFDQRKILRAVDGTNTLNDIIILSDLDYFRTYQIIYNLAKNGIIEITGVSFETDLKKINSDQSNNHLLFENDKLLLEIQKLNNKLMAYETTFGKDILLKTEKLSEDKRELLLKVIDDLVKLSQ